MSVRPLAHCFLRFKNTNPYGRFDFKRKPHEYLWIRRLPNCCMIMVWASEAVNVVDSNSSGSDQVFQAPWKYSCGQNNVIRNCSWSAWWITTSEWSHCKRCLTDWNVKRGEFCKWSKCSLHWWSKKASKSCKRVGGKPWCFSQRENCFRAWWKYGVFAKN